MHIRSNMKGLGRKAVCLIALLACIVHLIPAQAQETLGTDAQPAVHTATSCPQDRIRMDWNEMTDAEKDLWFEAFTMFSDTGLHNLYTVIHVYFANQAQAHGTSAFFPWHRIFLLHVENAIRLMDKKFECITIPYWNWAAETSDCIQNNGCRNMLNAYSLLRHTGGGGDTRYPYFASTFDRNDRIEGYCAPGASNFAWGRNSQVYMDGYGYVGSRNCLARGLYGNTYPQLASTSQIVNMIYRFGYYGAGNGFRAAFEVEGHAPPHVRTTGFMRTMISPHDIIFYSHHAYVDKIWALWSAFHGYDSNVNTNSHGNHFAATGRNQDYIGSSLQFGLPANGRVWYAPAVDDRIDAAWTPYTRISQTLSPSWFGDYSYRYSAGPLEWSLFGFMMDGTVLEEEMGEKQLARKKSFDNHFVILDRSRKSRKTGDFSVSLQEGSGASTDQSIERLITAAQEIKEILCEHLKQPKWQDIINNLAKESDLAGQLSDVCDSLQLDELAWEELINEECVAMYTKVIDGQNPECTEDREEFFHLMAPQDTMTHPTNMCCEILKAVQEGAIKLINHATHLTQQSAIMAESVHVADLTAYLDMRIENHVQRKLESATN